MSGPPDLWLFFGRLHPVLVHLPIGFIVLLAVLELIARSKRFRNANAGVGVILALAVPLALGSALCGWLLSLAGGYDARLLQLHKWTGIGTAAACIIVALLYWLDLKKAYRWCLALTIPALAVASHFGGSLTHGNDYLVRYAPQPLRALLGYKQPSTAIAATKPKDFADLQVFAGAVQPVLQQNCVTCHGPDKSKGGLRLDSLQALLHGSKDGAVIVPGKAADSSLLKRLLLPPEEEDHMPPAGKPQPSADDIALLQWWVEAGAPADKKVRELKPPANVARILQARFNTSLVAEQRGPQSRPAVTAPPLPLSDVLPLAAKITAQLNIPISALSPSEPWLQCNAAVAGTNFGDADLAKLAPIAANLRWLDLAGTAVTDEGLARLSAMPNLTRLHLERTAVTDDALPNLAKLSNLEYLNLYATDISDDGLEPLQKLPKLKHLYLWQTRVTPASAKAFAEARLDKPQLQRWQDEIEQLKARIRDQQISVDLGTPLAAPAATNAAPVNAMCPVSGKPVNVAKTVVHDGALIAFCCDDCKAQFQKDPKPYLQKLALNSKTPSSTTTKTK